MATSSHNFTSTLMVHTSHKYNTGEYNVLQNAEKMWHYITEQLFEIRCNGSTH